MDSPPLNEDMLSAMRQSALWAIEERGGLRSLRDLSFPIREDLDIPWRIEGVIPPGISLLIGRPGVGKSFLALSWAYHVAHGQDWHGRAVRQGAVLYLAPELNDTEQTRRLEACRIEFGVGESEECFFRNQDSPPLKLNSAKGEDVDEVIRYLDYNYTAPEGLIVIDTLAEHFEGDENGSVDMGAFVTALRRIRSKRPGYDILVVHHTTKDGNEERSHSSLRATADVVLRLNSDHRLDSPKPPRCAAAQPPLQLHLKQVAIADAGTTDPPPLPSAVMVLADARCETSDRHRTEDLALLTPLAQGPMTVTAWSKAIGKSPSSLSRYADGRLAKYVTRGADKRYALTAEGQLLLAAK